MARTSRSNDWGFPRWRSYNGERGATQVRLCDREGCSEAGDRPAPKAPNSHERWYFCESHAAEYHRNWDYFAGLSAEEAAAREREERGDASGYSQTSPYAGAGAGDGTRSRDEMRAPELQEREVDAGVGDRTVAYQTGIAAGKRREGR